MQCHLCNEEPILTACNNKIFSFNREIYQCQNCKSCFVHPLPDSKTLHEYYSQIWSNDNKNLNLVMRNILNLASFTHMRLKNSFRWPFIKSFLKQDHYILEIGAGEGNFASFLKKKGFNISVIEPSQEFQKKLLKKNITVISSSIEEMPKNKFDICFLFHVFEHLNNPLETLIKIRSLLKPNGILLGEVPNVPFNPDKLSQVEQDTTFNNAHLFHYSCQGLKHLFQKAGFSYSKCLEIGFSHKGIRKIYPKANFHLLYPTFHAPLSQKTFSLFHAFQSILKPHTTISCRPSQMGYQEPNDFIFFRTIV